MRMKMASIQQPLSSEALPSPLSSRPERRAAERSLCGCLFLEMFFDGAKPRDLRFLLVLAQTPKLVASQRTAVQQSSLNLLGPERSSKQSTRYIVKKSI